MYVPACDERKTKKVSLLAVDTVVFDIEDGVAKNQKARRHVVGSVLSSKVVKVCKCQERVSLIWVNPLPNPKGRMCLPFT